MTTDALLDWAQILAFGIAAAFFLAKLYAGFFIVSLSVEPTSTRTHMAVGDKDLLVVRTRLRGGDSGAVRLDAGVVRLTKVVFKDNQRAKEGKPQFRQLEGMDRLKLDRHNLKALWDVNATWPGSERRPLKLPRGEVMETACEFQVEGDASYDLDILVVGHSWQKCRLAQWRSSLVSTPVPPSPETADVSDDEGPRAAS